MNKHIAPVLATWRNEANALRDGTHPERQGVSAIMRMREEVTLRVCICDLSTALQAAAAESGRPITAIELGQLQALNRPELNAPECPDLPEDTGEAFDFKIGFHYARQKMKPAESEQSLNYTLDAEAREALARFDDECRRKLDNPKPARLGRWIAQTGKQGNVRFVASADGLAIAQHLSLAWAFETRLDAMQAAINAVNLGHGNTPIAILEI